jgi:integrase
VTRWRRPGGEWTPRPSLRPDTVATIAARFIAEYAKPRNRSWRETERIFRVYVLPVWGGRDITTVARRDVRELLEAVARDHGPIMSNRTLSAVRKLFAWSLERDIVATSPAAGVRPVAKETSRDRVLSDDELRAFWHATAALAEPWGSFFRVLALTGQRLGEVAGMRWSDVDLDRALWTLPAALNKSGRLHEVPLSKPVAAILRGMPRRSGPFVFTTGDGSKPPAGFNRPKAAISGTMKTAERWTLHDLRRTFATTAARFGVAPHVVEKVLNHSGGTIRGVAAVYNRAGYDAEKRHALEAWARHLTAEPSGNVVALR